MARGGEGKTDPCVPCVGCRPAFDAPRYRRYDQPQRLFALFRDLANDKMSSADIKAKRPLSPHLQIYRWHLTMLMSIAHRITGAALYFGTLLLTWWLVALAAGPGPFGFANRVLGSWFGLLVLFGYSWALIHHMLGGLRHFTWDFGLALGKPARDRIAFANLAGSIVITVLLWAVGLALR